MGASNYVHLEDVTVVRKTDSAFLLRLDDDTEEWFPRSQVADPDDYDEGDEGCTVSVTEWIAKKKGIETA